MASKTSLSRAEEAAAVDRALDALLALKPKGHQSHIGAPGRAVARHTNVTGG
jgi:hypothetical protein